MAVAVEAGLVARHLCWVPALPHMHTDPLWASVSSSPGSCKGEKGMRAEGSWLALVLSPLFQRLKQPFGVGEAVLVPYFPTTHLNLWHSWKLELGEAVCCFPFPQSLRAW